MAVSRREVCLGPLIGISQVLYHVAMLRRDRVGAGDQGVLGDCEDLVAGEE